MQISQINNFRMSSPRPLAKANSTKPAMQDVAFTGDDKKKSSRAMRAARDLAIASMFLTPVASSLTSCDKDDYGYVRVEVNAWAGIGSYIDSTSCNHPTDTIIKWWYDYQRPLPLDSLLNNMGNWGIDGADGNMNDSTSKRNIVHYEGTREWEYGSREIGDMNIGESSKHILVYDTEIKDYKGAHESYGKRVLRFPSGSFTIKKEDGSVLKSPKGLFVEEYENEFDEKNGSILDCKIKSRAFVQTNGDTLNVARRKGTSEFVETGKVAKGYLGANSILLKNLIGDYPTDDHFVDFKVEAVNDNELRKRYVEYMDKKED